VASEAEKSVFCLINHIIYYIFTEKTGSLYTGIIKKGDKWGYFDCFIYFRCRFGDGHKQEEHMEQQAVQMSIKM